MWPEGPQAWAPACAGATVERAVAVNANMNRGRNAYQASHCYSLADAMVGA